MIDYACYFESDVKQILKSGAPSKGEKAAKRKYLKRITALVQTLYACKIQYP
jgi:hypothetical protein